MRARSRTRGAGPNPSVVAGRVACPVRYGHGAFYAREAGTNSDSSARYYQRPDRTFANGCFLSGCFNPAATSMRGLGGYARIAKDGGQFNWETAINTRTPGFEVNDISFLSRADYVWQVANITYNWTTPSRWYRYLYALVATVHREWRLLQLQGVRRTAPDAQEHLWCGSRHDRGSA